MKRIKTKAFTLLELMVCLAIIGLLSVVLGVKGMDLLAHHRFCGSLQTLLFDIQRWQILAMTQGCDVVCRIEKNKEGHYMAYVEPDRDPFLSTSYDLKEVKSFLFQSKPVTQFQVTLFSSGRISPSGILIIESKKKEEYPFWIDFSYPMALQTGHLPSPRLATFPSYPEKSQEKN